METKELSGLWLFSGLPGLFLAYPCSKYTRYPNITGVAISSLLQRHNFNVTDLLLKTLQQKVVTFFLQCFNKNRVREQLDDMITPVKGKCSDKGRKFRGF